MVLIVERMHVRACMLVWQIVHVCFMLGLHGCTCRACMQHAHADAHKAHACMRMHACSRRSTCMWRTRQGCDHEGCRPLVPAEQSCSHVVM